MRFGIFTLLIAFFAGWVVIAGSAEKRIERVCEPAHWAGNIAVSITQLISFGSADSVQAFFDKSNYSCRFTVWRLIYEKDYLNEINSEKEAKTNNF